MLTCIRADGNVIRTVPLKHNLAKTIKTTHVYSFDVAISFLRTYRETPAIVENGMMYKLIHLVALFVRAKDCKESKCSSIEDQFNEWQICTVEYYTAIKRMSKHSAVTK